MDTILFEMIIPAHRWIIRYYLLRKKKILFIDMRAKVHKQEWVKKAMLKGKIQEISFGFERYVYGGYYFDLGLDNTEKFFYSLGINDNILLKVIKGLYKDDDIELLFKKTLYHNYLARFYYFNHIMGDFQLRYKEGKLAFVPSGYLTAKKTDGCEIYDYLKFYRLTKGLGAFYFDTGRVEFPRWAIWFSWINAFRRRCKLFFVILGLVSWNLLILLRKLIKRCKHESRSYAYGIMVLAHHRKFANKIQKVDFLIDNQVIKKEDALFISYFKFSPKNKEYMEDNKLNYIDDADRYVSPNEIILSFPIYLLLLSRFFRESFWILDSALRSVYFFLRWHGIAREFKIRNLITEGDFSRQAVARNIILSQYGCKTYFYLDTVNYEIFFPKRASGNDFKFRHFAFINYDYSVSANDAIAGSFKASGFKVKNWLNLGYFWAEHLRLISEGKIPSDFKDKLSRQGCDNVKLVTVFDSGYDDNSLTTYDDGIKFLEGVLKLLDDLPYIFVVMKEKWPRSRHERVSRRFADILGMYNKFDLHERCLAFKNSWENSSELMAFCDLVISFPFTSSTFEAISAGKKALYYDPVDKFRGSYYDEVPGLICHNYGELFARTKYLLSDSGDHTYREEIKKYKAKFDGHLDGLAITRFYRLLQRNNNFSNAKAITRFRQMLNSPSHG